MSKDLEKAKELLKSGKFAHVLCKGDQFFVSCETGTEPLANWARGGITITGGAAASKVITKKSIAFYLMLEVKEVYAPVIGNAARESLEKSGIKCYCESVVCRVRRDY